jgi:hypothetical protein
MKILQVVRVDLSVFVLLSLLGACAPGYLPPPVSPQLAKFSSEPTNELQRGHLIHQAKCAKCHAFENPADYDADEWADEIMPKMAKKSKLSFADESAVLAYLLAARQMPPPADPN